MSNQRRIIRSLCAILLGLAFASPSLAQNESLKGYDIFQIICPEDAQITINEHTTGATGKSRFYKAPVYRPSLLREYKVVVKVTRNGSTKTMRETIRISDESFDSNPVGPRTTVRFVEADFST